jgi:hypothetical protein
MKTIRYVFPGLCSLALVNGPMLNALASGAPDESWQIVPEETLSDLRGGLDLGPLIGSFAIQRVVEINGQVVARMQIVISNLNRLGQGGMPTISISGPLAQLVQVFNPAGVSASLPTNSSSAAPASPPANSAAPAATASTATPAPQSTPVGSSPGSAATVATNNGPHIGSTSGNSGTTSATGTQTGSTPQFGAAISQAVAAANGATSANAAAPAAAIPSAATASASHTSAPAPTPTTAAPSTAARSSASQTSIAPVASATVATSTAAAASAANPAQSSTRTIPVGNTGNVIVVSNIPNATAITSEVQNSVQATRVQTLTTITATLNSLQLLNAAAIANAVRQQIASGH